LALLGGIKKEKGIMYTAHFRKAGMTVTLAFALGVLLTASSAPPSQNAAQQTAPSDLLLSVDSARSTVRWTLGATLHSVHGTFIIKRGTLRLSPESGSAGGEIVVDATRGESGNSSRDSRMHKEILESARFPEVVFHPDQLQGKLLLAGTSSVQLHGSFLLHGSQHEFTVPVQAELSGDHWTGTAAFTVPYVQWGVKNPSNFFLKASPTVDVELNLSGTVQHPSS
jgi:hypothetical protein